MIEAMNRGRREDLEAVFTRIFLDGYWKHCGSVSGSGSLPGMNLTLIEILPLIFEEFEVRRFLDVPCGDWAYMRRVNLSGVDYTGVDIVGELIERNRQAFEGPKRRFVRMDATKERLPAADLVLCKDLLGHLPLVDVMAVLGNIRSSGAKWLLSTTFPQRKNRQIEAGEWQAINLEAEPFGLPRPVRLMSENCNEAGYEDKRMGLWSLK